MKKITLTLFIFFLFTAMGFSQLKYNILAVRYGMKQDDGSYKNGKLFKKTGTIIFDFGKVYISTNGLVTLNIDSEIGDIIIGDYEFISYAVTDPKTKGNYKFVVRIPVKPSKDDYNIYSILYDNGFSKSYISSSIAVNSP